MRAPYQCPSKMETPPGDKTGRGDKYDSNGLPNSAVVLYRNPTVGQDLIKEPQQWNLQQQEAPHGSSLIAA